MTVLILTAYSVIAFFQVSALVRKKHWRDLVFCSVLLALALTITLLYSFGVELPSPIREGAKLMDMLNLKFNFK